MAVLDEDLQRLWSLLAELSSQLSANREQCEALKRQTEDLKAESVHAKTGYALRRFNIDLSKEQFESELERMNAQLVVENQTLQHENRQLNMLLKDYETTLEQVMTKFRTYAHSSETHDIELIRYYESALSSSSQSAPSGGSPAGAGTLNDPVVFHSLTHLSHLLHAALRSLSNESPPSPSSPVGSLPLGIGGEGTRHVPRAHDPSEGGYIGPRGSVVEDEAMRSAVEVERVQAENAYLRELLGIAREVELGGAVSSSALDQGRQGHGEAAAAVARTGAGVVVPEELLSGATGSSMTRREREEEERLHAEHGHEGEGADSGRVGDGGLGEVPDEEEGGIGR